jgi:hypothetical protein
MSNQNKFNTKAIELNHDELEAVVGGSAFQASQAALQGAVNAAKARAIGAQLAANKVQQTEYAKGI